MWTKCWSYETESQNYDMKKLNNDIKRWNGETKTQNYDKDVSDEIKSGKFEIKWERNCWIRGQN